MTPVDETKIQTILGDYLDANSIREARENSQKRNEPLMEYVAAAGLLEKDLLGQVWAEYFGVRYADLNTYFPPRERREKIPFEVAKKLRIVLFEENDTEIIVATDSPDQFGLDLALTELFPQAEVIVLAYSLSEDIDEVLLQYRKSLETRFSRILAEQKRVAPEMLDEILMDALSFRASDIHFEPAKTEVLIRFRVDGVLQEAGRFPREYYDNILNRIKVQSRLRIDEHFSAQDGSFHFEKDAHVVDVRVSILPTLEGEKVVFRLLSSYVRNLSLGELGLTEAHQKILEEAIHKPFGMILATGPTGSGKTTTLYSLLKALNRPEVNIMTIEDPVEYKVAGVNQIQVRPEANLSFARGLRSIVRQDPDIILVGEIRDEETAEISVNAALTGHLLLSTFHANDAATALPRLFEMHIEPFLLASTINIVIAQRLARRICERCRTSVVADRYSPQEQALLKKTFGKEDILVFGGKGCEMCNFTGYKGRIAIFECIRMTPELQALLLESPSKRMIWELASKQGSQSLFSDGMQKVKAGLTTLEEVLRVAEVPEEMAGNVKKV